MNHECGMESKFRCELCLKRFRRKYYLKKHVALKHGGETQGIDWSIEDAQDSLESEQKQL